MGVRSRAPGVGAFLYFSAMGLAGAYLTYAAVQGDHGLFRRIDVQAQISGLELERDALKAEEARLASLSRRLSDDFLDLDLLDERARDVLGYVSASEVVLP